MSAASVALIDGKVVVEDPTRDPAFARLLLVPGRHYVDGAHHFPSGALDQVVAELRAAGFDISEAVASPRQTNRSTPHVVVDGLAYVIDIRDHPEARDDVHAIPGRRFDRPRWRVPITSRTAELVLELCERWGMRAGPGVVESLEAAREEEAFALERSRALAPLAPVVVPWMRATPKVFQAAGIEETVRRLERNRAERRGVLINDDQGLGKTLEGPAAVVAAGARRVLVVTKASMLPKFTRDLNTFFSMDGLVAEWTRSGAASEAQRVLHSFPERVAVHVVVTSWDLLGKHAGALGPWADALVLDEVHAALHKESSRTKALLEMASEARERGALVVGMTGTAFRNRAKELIPVLQVLGWLDVFGGWESFVTRYCGGRRERIWMREWRVVKGKRKRVGEPKPHDRWVYDETTNREELGRRLRETVSIRRLKLDATPELRKLPPQRVLVPMPVAWASEYARAEDDLAAYVAERAAANADRRKATAARLARERAAAGGKLVQFSTLRSIVGRAKVDATIAFVNGILDGTDERALLDGLGPDARRKVVVFAHHTPVIDALVAAFPKCAVVRGGDRTALRDEAVRRFQEDEGCRVLVGATLAGGEGLTLTAASHIVIAELEYTAAIHVQAEDRLCRIGQEATVVPTYVIVPGTIDEVVLDIEGTKRQNAEVIFDGAEIDEDAVDVGVAEALYRSVAERALARASSTPS